ncbi:MAG: sigma 54-interacting transcriptional regulator [Negativicutes bacterium]|nr:sigma 54-interacting transcriptional regulator [Negativicutes bacterium]
MRKTLCFIGQGEIVCQTILGQMKKFFEDYVDIVTWCIDSDTLPPFADCDLYVASYISAYHHAKMHLSGDRKILSAERIINPGNFDRLLDLEAGTKVVVVGNSRDRAEFVVHSISAFGIDHLEMKVHYPGNQAEIPETIKIAVIAGQNRLIPDWVTEVIDLGVKDIALTTYVEIIQNLGIPPAVLNEIASYYMQAIFDTTLKLHDVARINSELKKSMEIVFQNVDDPIIAVNLQGEIQIVNPASERLFDVATGLAGVPVGKIIPDLDFRSCLEKGESINNEFCRIGNQYYLVAANPIESQAGAILGAVITIKPVSKVQEMENKVRRELKPKGNIARYTFSQIIGDSTELKKAVALAKRFAKTDLTVLLEGESGVGKELFAQSMHNASGRFSSPFVALNFAALPEPLAESELFGYEEGAFTGARKGGKNGLFEEAHTGTLFLDEIGDASLELQARLLRVLEEKEVRRIGGRNVTPVDVRVIAATNKNIADLVKEGRFRTDLFFRLCVLPVYIPPLRNRGDDLFLLVQSFARSIYQRTLVLSPALKELLAAYEWPGNIREVQNVVKYICNLVDAESVVSPDDLPRYLVAGLAEPAGIEQKEQDEYQFARQIERKGLVPLVIAVLTELQKALIHNKNAGGGTIALALADKGLQVPTYKIRNCLKMLSQEGFLDTGVTKQGSKINAQGQDLLRQLTGKSKNV